MRAEVKRNVGLWGDTDSTAGHELETTNYIWMVTPEEAALLAGLAARTIYRRVEGGSVHFTESADGTLLICADSIVEPI